jgi:hypothetical protein
MVVECAKPMLTDLPLRDVVGTAIISLLQAIKIGVAIAEAAVPERGELESARAGPRAQNPSPPIGLDLGGDEERGDNGEDQKDNERLAQV